MQQHEGVIRLENNMICDLSESYDSNFLPPVALVEVPRIRDGAADLNSGNSSDLAPSNLEDSSDNASDSSGFARPHLVATAIFIRHLLGSTNCSSNLASSLISSDNDSELFP